MQSSHAHNHSAGQYASRMSTAPLPRPLAHTSLHGARRPAQHGRMLQRAACARAATGAAKHTHGHTMSTLL